MKVTLSNFKSNIKQRLHFDLENKKCLKGELIAAVNLKLVNN